MRDLETISVALTAAETGHLVFATLHTQDAAQTIDRVIDVFPAAPAAAGARAARRRAAGRRLPDAVPRRADGTGRAVATEVLVATPAIRNLIREGKTHQIYSAMQAGAKHGMHTMDQHLAELVKTRPDHLRDRPREVPPRRGLQPAHRPRLRGSHHGSDADLRVRGPRPGRQDRRGHARGRHARRPWSHEAQEHGLRARRRSASAASTRHEEGAQDPRASATRSSSRTSRSSRGSSRR